MIKNLKFDNSKTFDLIIKMTKLIFFNVLGTKLIIYF